MKKYIWSLFLIGVIFFWFTLPTFAAETTGIKVHPSLVMLDLASDTPQTTLSYTNNTDQTILLTFSSADVTELNDSYQLSFLDKKDARNFKYGLSSWISFSSNSLLLAPHDSDTVTLFIDSDKLSPGGHYGSVLATVEQTTGTKNVSLKTVIATLVFVRTHTGKEYEKGSITTFAPEQTFFDIPKNFLLRFTNNGDTYVIPYGEITVYDIWGRRIGHTIVNSGSLVVLPESLRRMEIPFSLSGIVWPGFYHADVSLHFGKSNIKRNATTLFFTFGSLPFLQIISGVLLGLLCIIILKRRYLREKER